MIRYRTLDLPPVGAGAVSPVPALNPVASSYGLVHIDGNPGTLPVPVRSPRDQWGQPPLTRNNGISSAQDSACAPNVILPAIYIPLADNMGPAADTGLGMTRRRWTELPVPAVDPGRRPVPVFITWPMGGRSVLPLPRAFQRWPLKTTAVGP